MSVSIVNDVQIEVRRLAVAGSDVAVGDNRMKRLAPDIRKIGGTLPVFARLAGSIESLTNPEAGGSAGNLLEAATLTNALLYTQGVFGVEGELVVPENPGPDLPTSASYRTISRVKEAMDERGGARLELFRSVCEGGGFVDLRLLDMFIGLLYSPSNDVANLVCGKILPAYGEAVLPQLLSGYNVKGRVGDGRRLELIAGILKEKGEDMYLDALRHGSDSVKVGALKCVKYVPGPTDIIIECSRSKGVSVRRAAFKMLAETDSEAATDRIVEALRNDEELHSLFYNDSPKSGLVSKLIEEGDSYLACCQQKKADKTIAGRFKAVLRILLRGDSPDVREFFERSKRQPECLVMIAELDVSRIDVEDPDVRRNLLSALRLIVHSPGEYRTNHLSWLSCIMVHAAILEDDREAVDLIVRFAPDPSSPISNSFTYSIYHYTDQQLKKKTDFPVTRRLFEIALDIVTLPQSSGTCTSLFCNALWVMQKDSTGLPVDREMNEKFLGKCLPYGPKNPEIYFNAVCLYVEMGEYDKALECVGLAKKHDYRDYDGMMERIRTTPVFAGFRKDGLVVKMLERYYLETIESFDRVLELNLKDINAWDNKGFALGRFGKYSEAVECYDKVLELDPTFVRAWYNKGCYFGKLGRHQEAVECYDKALELDPAYVNAWNNKGYSFEKLGMYLEEIDCCDKALELDQGHVNAWGNKGFALGMIGRYQEGIKCCDKALELDPKSASAWGSKGHILGKLGEYQEAIKCYDKTLELNPENAGSWYNKGTILKKLDRTQEALECYDKALGLDPHFESAIKAKEDLSLNTPT
ncbi:MAG TPA: tetratricopeptide repeat protein [Methanocella sp.]|nr:tetratricopeptide repeat protein [Methanocella sp.]